MAGDRRPRRTADEAQRIERTGEVVPRAGVGFEHQLVALRLVPAEIEHGMPAVRAVVTVVPAARIELRMPRLQDVAYDWVNVGDGARGHEAVAGGVARLQHLP